LAALAEDAEYFQPRLFAVYGVQRRSGAPFLGWGLALTGDGGAVFVQPGGGGTHSSDSAERLLTTYRRIGEAHLLWLD
jgi:hypothetical protein